MKKRGLFLVLMILFSASVLGVVGDFNSDGCVNFNDFTLFAQNYGKQISDANKEFDLDLDGKILFSDFAIFAQGFGSCEEVAAIIGDLDGDGCVSEDDVNIWNTRYDARVGIRAKTVEPDLDIDENGVITLDDLDALRGLIGEGCQVSVSPVSVEGEGFDCLAKATQQQKDHCWDLQAVRNANEAVCENILDAESKYFCKYRVQIFSGTYSKVLRGYHLKGRYDTMELSVKEYEALGERDSKVVMGGLNRENLLFVIEAPTGVESAKMYFSVDSDGRAWYIKEYRKSVFGNYGEEGGLNLDKDIRVRVNTQPGYKGYKKLGDYKERNGVYNVPIVDGKLIFRIEKLAAVDRAFSSIDFDGKILNPDGEWA